MALLKCNMLVLPLIFKIGPIDISVLQHHLGDPNAYNFARYNPRFLKNRADGWTPPYFPENQCLIAFCIISWEIAKSKWFYNFQHQLKEGNFLGGKFFRVYKIILERSEMELPPADYSVQERQALVLDAVYSYFKNSDAEGAACRRVIELMNRIMGADLSGIEFPDYNLRDLARIAWHTNREDFNWDCDEPRKNAIKKYKIVDNFPAFAIERL